MSRLIVPFQYKVLRATGDIRLWVDLELLVKDNAGRWRRETFRVDTASDLTTMCACLARSRDLPMPRSAAPHAKHHPSGLVFCAGYLRFRIRGMDPTEYATPCLFLGDPNVPPVTVLRSLLQPCALVRQLRFTFDYDPLSYAPHGVLVIEKQ